MGGGGGGLQNQKGQYKFSKGAYGRFGNLFLIRGANNFD